jgi:adenosylhomocysteine nucleosidase
MDEMDDGEPGGGDAAAHVAVLAPMRSELQPVVQQLALRRAPSRGPGAGPVVYTGRRGDVAVTAVLAGVGTGPAAAATERVLTAFGPVDHVVVVGIAGGIAEGQAIGDLVVPELVVHGVTGAEHRPHRLGPEQPAGILSTSDELVVDPAAVAALVDRGVVALDMETAAIAAVCERHGRPWSVYRAISDRAADGLVDPAVAALAAPDGSAALPAVLKLVARHPSRVRTLARLGRDMKIAARAAAVAAAAGCATVVRS